MLSRHALMLAATLSIAMPAQADTGFFAGLAYTFGVKGGLGVTFKITSTEREDRLAAVGGITWYPKAIGSPIGFDVGAGYVGSGNAVGVSWDILAEGVQGWFAFGNTENR